MKEVQPIPKHSRLKRAGTFLGSTAGLVTIAAIAAREPVKKICAVDNTPVGITSPAPHFDNFPRLTISDHSEVVSDNPPFMLVASGATTSNRAAASMRGMLEEMYGVENVHVYNSPSSSDPEEVDGAGNPVRYQQMADEISASLDSGREIHALVYSEGATVLARAIKMLQEQRPDLFNGDNSFNKFKITLLSPSGFAEGVGQRVCLADKLFELQVAIGSPRQPNEVIESFVSFPPLYIPPHVVDEMLSKIYPQMDQLQPSRDASVQVIDFQPVRDYWDVLDDNMREKLTEIDKQIYEQFKSGHFDAAKKIAEERSEILEPVRGALYGGDYYPENEGEEKPGDSEQSPWAARGRLASLVWEMVTGNVVETYQRLKAHGAQIVIVVPEYDIHLDLDDAMELIDEDGAYILERYVHTAIAPQPKALEPLVAPRYKKPTPTNIIPQQRQVYPHRGNR